MKIRAGYYYRNGWLRKIGNIDRGRVFLADFSGINSLSVEHMQRWAKEEYTEEEAKAKFPDECAEIDRALDRGLDLLAEDRSTLSKNYRIVIDLRVEDEAALRAHAKEFAEKIGMGTNRDCEVAPIRELVLWLLDDTLHLLTTKDAVVPRADGVQCLGSFINQIPEV